MNLIGKHAKMAEISLGLLLIAAMGLAQPLGAQTSGAGVEQLKPATSRRVLVSLGDRKLAVVEGGKVIREFVVSVGAAASPSPTGEFRIVSRLKNPTYYHTGVVIPPGADNPVGPRWIGLNKKGYGIHGTNEPKSIGKAASHGCIRLRNRDIEQFFQMVKVGDTVEIHGERDEEMAQIFGRGSRPATMQADFSDAILASAGQ